MYGKINMIPRFANRVAIPRRDWAPPSPPPKEKYREKNDKKALESCENVSEFYYIERGPLCAP